MRATYDPETAGGQAPDGRKVKSTIHWVSAPDARDIQVAEYDRLFSDPHPGSGDSDPMDSFNPEARTLLADAKAEPSLADIEPGGRVQFERLGYFARDSADATLFHQTVGLRDEWARIQKRRS